MRDSVSHIAHIDDAAVRLLRGDNGPLEEAARVKFGFTNMGPQKGRSMKAPEVLSWWREARGVMIVELSKCDPKKKIPWFAMPMGARAFATARLMETWAHGLDCFDAGGAVPEDTDRLRHVALLAYMARRCVLLDECHAVSVARVGMIIILSHVHRAMLAHYDS